MYLVIFLNKIEIRVAIIVDQIGSYLLHNSGSLYIYCSQLNSKICTKIDNNMNKCY